MGKIAVVIVMKKSLILCRCPLPLQPGYDVWSILFLAPPLPGRSPSSSPRAHTRRVSAIRRSPRLREKKVLRDHCRIQYSFLIASEYSITL